MLKMFVIGIPVIIVLFILFLIIDNEIEKGWGTYEECEKLKKINNLLGKICLAIVAILFILAIANLVVINTAETGFFAVESERLPANVFFVMYIISNILWVVVLLVEGAENFMFKRAVSAILWGITLIATIVTIFACFVMLICDNRGTGNVREEIVETTEIVALNDYLTLNVSGGRYYIGTTPGIAYIYIPENEEGYIEQKVLDGSTKKVRVYPNSSGEPRIERYEIFKEYMNLWGEVYEESAGYRYEIHIPNDLQYVFNLDNE